MRNRKPHLSILRRLSGERRGTRKTRGLIAAACLLLFAGNALALTNDDLLFYCPFDGSLEPTVHRGDGGPKATGTFTFAKGKAGRGVLVGKRGTMLEYPAAGNFEPRAGAISVWVKPLNWESRDNRHHIFFSLRGNPRWLLYKYAAGNTWFYIRVGTDKLTRIGPDAFDAAKMFLFKPGRWAHIAVSWQDGRASIRVNNIPFGRVPLELPEKVRMEKFFSVGSPVWKTDVARHDTVIDELMIFRRPLTAEEVAALYGRPPRGGLPENLPEPPAFAGLPAYYPTAEVLSAALRPVGLIGRIPPGARYEAALSDGGAKAAADADAWKQVALELPVRDLRAGKHNLTVRLTADSKTLAAERLSFEKFPKPEWADNRLGFPKKVPPPWTPLEARSDRFRCWGRETTFAATLFPSQITTGGLELLAAPCALRLNGSSLGGEVRRRLLKSNELEADYTASCVSGGVRAQVDLHAEFDGFMWFRLRLMPRAAPVKVDSLTFEVPMHREAATLIITDYKGTGSLERVGCSGVFRPALWLGCETGGLQWFTTGQIGWSVDPTKPCVEAVREGDRTVLRITFVNVPVTLEKGKPFETVFGLMASPVKPYPRGWRNWRLGWIGHDSMANVQPWYNSWGLYRAHPDPRPDAPRMVRKIAQEGRRVTFYTSFSLNSPFHEGYQRYAWEWRFVPGAIPRLGTPPRQRVFVRCCPGAKTWRDYYIWKMSRVMDFTGAPGFYYDVSSLKPCANARHGCGYVGRDGKHHPTWNILGIREMAKRMYVMGKSRKADMLFIYHMSSRVVLPYLSFCDLLADGEQYTHKLEKQLDYTRLLPPDTFRAEFMGHNLGIPSAFFPEFWRGPGKKAYKDEGKGAFEHVLGLIAVHDGQVWPAWAPAGPMLDYWKAQDEFGWSDDVEFLPYWRQRAAEADSPEILVSVYRSPARKKAMLVLLNESDEPREAAVRLDFKRLALEPTGEFTAFDAFRKDAPVELKGNVLSRRLPPWNFAMVILAPKD